MTDYPIPPWTAAIAYNANEGMWYGLIRIQVQMQCSPPFPTREGAVACLDQAMASVKERAKSLGYEVEFDLQGVRRDRP